MSISEKDRAFMNEVAAYFRSSKETMPEGSIRDTAIKFNLTRTKVQKILITTGDYRTEQTVTIQEMRNRGLSVKEIAEELGLSQATVSSSLPYTDLFHGTAEPSDHARAVRDYRAYEKMQKTRQVQTKQDERKERKMDNNTEHKMKKDMMRSKADDWRKGLDSKLSFTATDSRRTRMTCEMIEQSGLIEQGMAIADACGIELPEGDDYQEEINKLRAKLESTGSLTPDEMLTLGEFPGALYDRNPLDLAELYGEDLPYEPREMIRLHLELIAGFTADEKEIMHKYGKMDGDTISRDILVSDDLPLYALHYVIQRAFGWQNSHLHRFYLSDERVGKFTESVEQWMGQVGVIYRSPFMDQYAEFWADDYERGSFKNWLRTKYTGPCVSQCWDEGLIGARESMKGISLDTEFYVEYGNYREGCDALPLFCHPVYGRNGKKLDPPKEKSHVYNFRVEIVKLRDLPLNLLNRTFERGVFDILERLTIGQVLVPHNMHCSDDFPKHEYVSTYQEMLDDGMDDEIDEILESGIDSPLKQPFVYSFTDELFYQYDFGDNWKIRITASRNCTDLVKSGKITQDMLDKSNIKARVTYRPVLLARDGEMLIDDVGGAGGMAEFIRSINTLGRGERDGNGMTKTELKEWAKGLGWHKGNSTDFNLI